MKRTQLYLDEGLYLFLEDAARREGRTISNYVREALRREVPLSTAGKKKAAWTLLRMAKEAGKGPKDLARNYENYLYGKQSLY